MKRGVKASPWPALDENIELCYSQAEAMRQAEVKGKRRAKEWRKVNQP
jgi:hypothetical protein